MINKPPKWALRLEWRFNKTKKRTISYLWLQHPTLFQHGPFAGHCRQRYPLPPKQDTGLLPHGEFLSERKGVAKFLETFAEALRLPKEILTMLIDQPGL